MDLQSLYGPDDRTNILTPVIGDVLACKNGSFEDLCNGCLNPNEIGNIEEMLKCCDVKQLGQSFVKWLQYYVYFNKLKAEMPSPSPACQKNN